MLKLFAPPCVVARRNQSIRHRVIRRAVLGAVATGLATLLPLRIDAQERAVPPTEVAVVADGASAIVTWTAVPVEGVLYRVVRTLDVGTKPTSLTDPIRETKIYDSKIEAGVTYFYQVIAVYPDATTAAAEYVSFTAPAVKTVTAEPLTLVTAIAPATMVMPPTAVTGVTVEGSTTASALVSWQVVPGATSYSVTRTYYYLGTQSGTAVSGLTTTSWTDHGPKGAGFPVAGTYTYDITANTGFGTVSGQATWTRPSPSCDEPPATLQPLTILDPAPRVAVQSTNPAGPVFYWRSSWTNNSSLIALRMDRSIQGSGVSTLAKSSCAGTIPPIDVVFDQIKGVVANTTYLYKLTGFAATGDIGVGTVAWTSPNPSVMHWISATAAGSNVTLNFRYEPPATNPPNATYIYYHVTAPYGFSQEWHGMDCGRLVGCSLVVSGVPAGTHVFTVAAEWKVSGNVVYRISSPTTVVVP
jgi:hypothetical protein